ncbi:hypothetical protein BDW59DRAFT_170061 [Aspergillus cavernicola]|uniref:Zn(2)-C6 fungal-type domain-containing protein n=1 Tax=Aspergillus cavernicola TaxID=176166 RepID=A0ABR4IRS4_9EURO
MSLLQNILDRASNYAIYVLPTFVLLYLIQQYFHNGLHSYPGPALAKFTNLWRFLDVRGRRSQLTHMALHREYGDVVRLGPNTLSFASPSAIKVIYGLNKGFIKSDFYPVQMTVSKGEPLPSLFSTLDESFHANLRRSVNHAFSMSSLVQYEPMVNETIEIFLNQTATLFANTNQTCDFARWLQFLAFDVIGSITYSKRHGFIEKNQDIDGILSSLARIFDYAGPIGQMPWLDKLLWKNPIFDALQKWGLVDNSHPVAIFARQRMTERMPTDPANDLGTTTQAQKEDLLTKFMKAGKDRPEFMTEKRILTMAVSMAFAGSETTAISLSAIFYYLLKHPQYMQRVREELDTAVQNGTISNRQSGLVTWSESQTLPFLDACIKESFRICPAAGLHLERVTPASGIEISGHFIPGGTIVGCSAWVMHRREEIFGPEVDTFNPDRWLTVPEEKLKTMNGTMLQFGAGSRTCIGKNISLMEIYKLVPSFLRRFEVQLAYPEQEWELWNAWFANDYTGPVKTRSREGCSECRASRVRCDIKKPACTRCQERGFTCTTQVVLKWESEFTSRGQAFGRAGVWSKSKAAGNDSPALSSPTSQASSLNEQEWCATSRVEPWGFVNTSVEALERPCRVKVAENDHDLAISFPVARRPVRMTGPTAPLSLFPQLSGTNQGHLFEYYIQEVCPRMTASANMPSPFASVIVPFCSAASPAVLKAIQALGACTWSRVDPEYSAVGLRLKSEAIRGLRNKLTAAGPTVSSDPEALVVMMLLCLYELVDHCDQRWTIHLKGAKALIGFRQQEAALLAPQHNQVTSFVEQFFAFQDVMGRTACGETSLFGTGYWQHNRHTVDPWMGCSPELVHIISDITDLSRARRDLASSLDPDRASLSLKAAKLSHQLEELVQDVNDGDESFQAVAELKRLAAILYLHCALYNSLPTSSLVVSYVRRILRLISEMLDAGSLIGLAWPVFVAAVELDPLNDELWRDADGQAVYGRPLVLRAVAAMSEFNVLSVARTRAVIVKDRVQRVDIMASSITPSRVSHSVPPPPFASNLSEQLSQRTELGETGTQTDSAGDKASLLGPSLRPSPKTRSLSDAGKRSSSLSSIATEERPSSKDDSALPSTPQTPRRSSAHGFPLNLQSLPPKASGPASSSSRAPLSPKLEPSHIYASPGSVLPRRSRGLDFSRACTNLHHSILAEPSPDSSPTVGGRGVAIPQRRGSHGSTSVAPFSTSNPADRTTISSSMSSVNMMESDTSSSEEDDEPMIGDRDDMIMNTPQAKRLAPGFNVFGAGNVPSPGMEWMSNYSQAAASLMSFQRARFRKGRSSRHSSSSASGNSSKQSPAPLSPPVMKSIENGNGYFGHKNGTPSRRQSLSLGTRDLRLSDMSDEGENRGIRGHSPTAARSDAGPLGVVRRAVTRRSSLLPKTKTFARIRAALMEESAPIDSDSKREAEVIRQVRETEPDMPQTSPVLSAFSMPNAFMPTGLGQRDDVGEKPAAPLPDEPNFSDQAHRHSGGPEFWNSFDERYRTPPPPVRPHAASSVSEEDIAMDMTPSTTFGTHAHEFVKPGERPVSRSSTPLHGQPGVISELRKKRRREDDFDPNLFKRRAVSPSMSAQSSPIMPNSPAIIDNGPNIWGPPPKTNMGPLFNDRSEAGSRNTPTTPHTGTLKRVGLQGMTETNDSLMNMSIE